MHKLLKLFTFIKRKLSFLLIHTSILIILIGGAVSVIYGDKAYVQISKGQVVNSALREDNSVWKLPFKIKLNNFSIEKYKFSPVNLLTILDKNLNELISYEFDKEVNFKIPGSKNIVKIIRILPDFRNIGKNKAINNYDKWLNPAIKIKLADKETWLLANFEHYKINRLKDYYFIYKCVVNEPKIKGYKTDISIMDGAYSSVKIIEVNKPLNYKGLTIYQFAYDKKYSKWLGLQIKKDPGVSIVLCGYIMLIAGLMLFIINKQRNILHSDNNRDS